MSTIVQQVIAQALTLGNGRGKVRVYLRDLRSQLATIDRATLDSTLLGMQRNGTLVLYRIDNYRAITPADTAATLLVGGEERHILYLDM